jgi:hypothetical protein
MARKISAVGQVLKDYYGLSDSFFETPIPEKVETTMIASMTLSSNRLPSHNIRARP